eukprot:1857292-Pleurochrysis_carterae.AAC.3
MVAKVRKPKPCSESAVDAAAASQSALQFTSPLLAKRRRRRCAHGVTDVATAKFLAEHVFACR